MTTTTKNAVALPHHITIDVAHARQGLDQPTLDALHHLARGIDQRCDAIGECGHRCTLRAGHPGEIHEEYAYGQTTRFRLDGNSWHGKDPWGKSLPEPIAE